MTDLEKLKNLRKELKAERKVVKNLKIEVKALKEHHVKQNKKIRDLDLEVENLNENFEYQARNRTEEQKDFKKKIDAYARKCETFFDENIDLREGIIGLVKTFNK